MGWDGGGGNWAAMVLMMTVVWAAVIGAVIVVARNAGRRHTARVATGDGTDQALRILDERFARGDIDAEEYRHRHELLGRA